MTFGVPVPVIETERLRLRALGAGDLDSLMAMWNDPAVLTHLGGGSRSREEIWMRILRYAGCWSVVGYGAWLVEARATGAYIGEVGFRELKRDSEPSFAGTPEIGWAILPAWHGRGVASEAVAAALAWGDAHIDAAETVCIIAPTNAPSLRLAARFGYERKSDLTYRGHPQVLLGRRRPLPA
jgi:RimJ/RimL family protein N-acetyltransferase